MVPLCNKEPLQPDRGGPAGRLTVGVWVGVAFSLAHEVASPQIESGYLANPYHNNIHAADVTQTMSFFITKPFLLPYVKPLEILASLLAAAIHDYRHPGLNNAFHVLTSDPLALLLLQSTKGAHVVQPVRQLHQHHADVAGHRQEHPPQVLRLSFRAVVEVNSAELGDTLHQFTHL